MRLLLDTGLLGQICHPRKHGDVREWCGRGVVHNAFLISELADYELRRELLRIGATRSIIRLDELGRELQYVPVSTVVWRQAAALVEHELPKTTHSAGDAIHAGNYVLHAQMARGADGQESVAYYTAVRHGRAEFAVGKDSLDTFKAHADTFQQQADHDWGITNARPYEQDSYRMGEHVSNGDFKGAVAENVHAWMHAWGDPVFAAQRALDVAVASAPEARAVRELGEAPRVLPPPNADEIAAVRNNSIQYVNKVKGTVNCANCAVATDATLAGKPASALLGAETEAADLSREYGRPWSSATTIIDIDATMKQAGPGARGVVLGARPQVNGNNVPGHFFNVVNDGGTVRFVDGQSGGIADLSARPGYNRFYLLRTN